MDRCASAARPQSFSPSARHLAMQFRSSALDPTTARLAAPVSKRRGRYGGVSLAVHSRSRKEQARARVALLPLWQGCRMLLALYIQLGRGARCRSWWSDRHIAEEMNRSGKGTYSVDHVRRCRRLLEDVGLVRSTYVAPHSHYGCADKCPCGHFPNPKAPDVDGGGARAPKGGRVVEVHLAGILGAAALWEGPLREMGWADAREARELAGEGQAPESRPDPIPQRPERPETEHGEAAAAHCAEVQRVGMDGQGRVGMDAHSCDLGSASQNASDHGRSAERPEAAPGTAQPSRAAERPADAGRRPPGPPALDATPAAARASLDAPPPSGPPRAERAERRPLEGSGEQAARQGSPAARPPQRAPSAAEPDLLAHYAALVPRAVAGFVADMVGTARPKNAPPTGWSEGESPRPRPPSVGLLFGASDLRPVGRHGERPRGWRGGGGEGAGGAGEPGS